MAAIAKKPIIFVIDDDQHVLRALNIVLRKDYEVKTFHDADLAIKSLSPEVCTIILDIKMPNRNGFDVFRDIRTLNAHVPIVFNSAYQDLRDESLVKYEFGPLYVQKGSDHKAFLQLIARMVAEFLARQPSP